MPSRGPSALDFSTPERASMAFALINSDFLNLDLDYPTTSIIGLALMIASLEATKNKFLDEDQTRIEQLLKKFHGAYDIEIIKDDIVTNCTTTNEFNTGFHRLNQELIAQLEKEETLYLASGWAGRPAGHNITLELTPFKNSDGVLMVRGRIQNRGAGIQHHQAFIKGTQLAYDPELALGEIPLDQLKNSTFLRNYLQLRFLSRPHDEKIKLSDDTMLPTTFDEDDFYNVFLPSWPGRLEYSKNPRPSIEQRGPTCTIKPLITEMVNSLGDRSGRLAKFYITLHSWENFMGNVGITEDNADQIASILPKLSRRALKLKGSGILSDAETGMINAFCKDVNKKIAAVLGAKIKRWQSQTTDINTKIQESTNYALQLPVIEPMHSEIKAFEQPPTPQASQVNIEQFIFEQVQKAKYYDWTGSIRTAQNIVLYSLRALPNPSNEKAWSSVKNPELFLKDLRTMQKILLEATRYTDKQYIITPQQACVWGKTLGIIYRLATSKLPSDLCQYYANGLKNLIDNRFPALFCPFSPKDLDGFQDAMTFIYESNGKWSKNTDENRPPIFARSCQQYSDNGYGYDIVIDSLKDALKNPELNYLHNIFKNNPNYESSKAYYARKYKGVAPDLVGIGAAYSHINEGIVLRIDPEEGRGLIRKPRDPEELIYGILRIDIEDWRGLIRMSRNPEELSIEALHEISMKINCRDDFLVLYNTKVYTVSNNLRVSKLDLLKLEYEKLDLLCPKEIDSILIYKGGEKANLKLYHFEYDNTHEYKALRQSYHQLYLALDLQESKGSSPWRTFLSFGNRNNDSTVSFTTTIPCISKRKESSLNPAVFADAFTGFDRDAEKFAIELLGIRRRKASIDCTNHNALAIFQHPEVINSIALGPLEIQDLLAARTKDGLPLQQIEHYFTENLPRLVKPFLQSLFMTLLFKADANTDKNTFESPLFESPLIAALNRSPPDREIDNFFAFLYASLKQARATQSWTIYFFLLRATAISLSYCLHHQSESPRTQMLTTFFNKELDAANSTLNLKKMTGSVHSTFDNCLLSMVPYFSNFEAMTDTIHTFHTIRAKLNVTQPDTTAIHDFHLQEDIQAGLFFIEYLPHLKDRVEREKVKTKMLPGWIAEHDLYTALFKINYPVQELSPGYYEFIDEKEITYRILSPSEHSIRIFRSFVDDGQTAWYSFQKDDPFKGYGLETEHPCSRDPAGYLQSDAVVWFKVGSDKKVRVINKKTDDLMCQATTDKIYHPKNKPLVLLNNYDQPVIKELARITSQTQMLAWKNDSSGELSSIELKEFGMRFDQEVCHDGRIKWKSTKHFGYYIDIHQKNSSFEPIPHYLVLTNDEGKQKLICPSRRYAPEKIKFAKPIQPKVHSDTVEQLFTYDIDSKGRICLPEEPKALLYLIYLSLEKQDYSHAFQGMQKLMQHPDDWDESMQNMMHYFELPNPNDKDKLNKQPPALALRLQLKAIMLSQTAVEMSATQKESLTKDYINYLNQLNSIQGFQRLSLAHERLLYNVLTDVRLSTDKLLILKNRIRYLQAQSCSFPEEFTLQYDSVKPEPHSRALSAEWGWIDHAMQTTMISALKNPAEIAFTMRPGIAFVHNFLFYYSILQQDTPKTKVDEIRELLKACRYDTDKHIICVRALLLGVVSNPTAFPPCRELFELSETQKNTVPENTCPLEITLTALVKGMGEEPVKELLWLDLSIQGRHETRSHPPGVRLESGKPKIIAPIHPKFDEIFDTLLVELDENLMITISGPGQNNLLELKQRLERLKEIKIFYETQAATPDPAIAREFGRLLEGTQDVMDETQQQITAIQSALSLAVDALIPDEQWIIEIKDKQIESSIRMLAKIATKEQVLVEKSEQEIETLLQTYAVDRALEMHGELYRPLTREEALIHFGRGDDTPFYRANPDLTREQLIKIKVKIGQYLLHKLNAQKRDRLLDDLKKVHDVGNTAGRDSIDYSVAKTRAIQTLRASRAYTAHESPHLLVFEAFANICLKDEQLAALNKLTQGDKKQNLIFEARTGFGKSKALIPLWLYLTGKKRKLEAVPGLSMMTVPAPLYQQQVSYLKKILGGAFNQSVLAFQFTREQGNDLRYLKDLNRRLDKAASEGMCVLTTVNSLHSLVNLKLKECLSLEKTAENTALLHELRALRYKASHQLSNFFDESRECFDIRQSFDYAVGAPKTIPLYHCKALQGVYETLLSLKLGVHFDFLPSGMPHDSTPLSEARFNDEIKKEISGALLTRLISNKIIPHPGEEYFGLLIQHFMGGYDAKIDPYLDEISEKKRRIYAIYRDQLNVYLPRTLTRQCNGRYGLAPEKTGNRFAYPFERGVPKLSSQFSTVDDLLDFTIQANLKTPFTQKDISQFITSLKFGMEQAANKQDFEDSDQDYKCYLNITESLTDWPTAISDCNQDHINQLQEALNNPENFRLKLAFISGHILPKITLHTKKVSSTAHNLVEAMEMTYGASGTINKDTLSPKLDTIEQTGTPIGSILSMWQNAQKAIYIVNSLDADVMLKASICEHTDSRVIIDVANTFRDLRDEKEIARIVFENTASLDTPPVDAFSYYDERGENMVFMRPKLGEALGEAILRDHCTVPYENIFIFMRQSSTVGADTPMAMTAKALVTVGTETQRDLFLQGVGRMRGLQSGQNVGFIIQQKDVPAFQNESREITLQSILAVVSKNQGEQRGQDLFFNLRLLLQNLLEQQFWTYFDDKSHRVDDCMALFHAMQDFFVENSIQNPLDSLKQSRGIISIEVAVKQIKDSFFRKLTPMLKNTKAFNAIEAESIRISFDKLVDFNKLPKTVKMGSTDECDRDVEVEAADVESKQAEMECDEDSQEEQVSESDNATISALPCIAYTPAIPLPSESYDTLGMDIASSAIKSFDAKFSPLLTSFYGSTNFFRMNSAGERPQGILKTAYQYLIIHEKEQFKPVLMDQQDGKAAMNKMIEDEGKQLVGNKDYYLMSSTGRVIAKNARQDFNEEQWNANPQLTVLTKIFTRQLNFSSEEVRYLADLESSERKLFFDFLDQEISSCWPPIAPVLMKLQSRVDEINLRARNRLRSHEQLGALPLKIDPTRAFKGRVLGQEKGVEIVVVVDIVTGAKKN